jgi:type IV pilus assembly protein PilY1
MRSIYQTLASLTILIGLSIAALADDTDIYMNPAVPSGAEPLVMLSLDYRSNLGSTACNGNECDTLIAEGYLAPTGPYTSFDVLRAALQKVLAPLQGVKIGFMMNHEHQNGCAGPQSIKTCSNGGYILSGFESMQLGDANGAKSALNAKLAAVPVPQGNQAHSYQGKELFFEFFRYLSGQEVYNGHNGWGDYATDTSQNLDTEGSPAGLRGWDAGIESGNKYLSPLAGLAGSCGAKIFTVNFLFQVSNQEDDSDNDIKKVKNQGGLEGINLQGNNNSFDTVIAYLKDADLADGTYGTIPDLEGTQNVVSYFLVDPTYINTTTTGYAQAGGTATPLPLSENPDELVATLSNIFKSILSVSTTFVAPSVPVNVFNRAQTVNEVFMALFEADDDGYPLWSGNLKKLRIADNTVTGVTELQDIGGNQAIDIDGRIKRQSVTFWTDVASLPAPEEDEVAGADGRSVKRGGAGQKIPGFISGGPKASNSVSGGRRLFTEDLSDATDGLRPLDADAAAADALWYWITRDWTTGPAATYGAASPADKGRALNILRFARGLEDDGTTMRNWLKIDPLHSRPLPLNYGARATGYDQSNPDIRLLVGTNDGYMHMFRNTDSSGAQDGSESWAFMPSQVMPVLTRLHDNTAGAPVHPVTVDGSPVAYVVDANLDGAIKPADGDITYVYFGLRRGGKSYYALDATDPDNPKFTWTITKTGAGTDFAELGQTWSTPQFGRVRVYNGVTDDVIPVLVFGGGYDGDDRGDDLGDLGKDAKNRATRAGGTPAVGTDDDEGNAVFIVNALDGSLVWKAVSGATEGYVAADKAYKHPELKDSVPARVAAADTDGDQFLDRIYFGDTGGVVWRIDLAGPFDHDADAGTPDVIVNDRPSAWTLKPLLSVGRHVTGHTTLADDRRFFNHPDIVQSRDASGPFDGVLIGSGDREDPHGTGVEHYFYMFKDRNVVSGQPPASALVDADLADLTDNCLQDDSCGTAPILGHGWRIRLPHSGEKNLAGALTLGGTVFFSTFAPTPPSGACSLSEGQGRLYAVSLQDATAVFNFDTVNDTYGVTYERSDNLESGGIPVEVVPLGDGLVLVQGEDAGDNILHAGGRTAFKTYWHALYE